MHSFDTRILVLCKTYPTPSGHHVETSCVAGMLEHGQLVRLFPIPFRLLEADKQFAKWQWITARVALARQDRRPESHRVYWDTIRADPKPLTTDHGWQQRRAALSTAQVLDDFARAEEARVATGASLALVKPHDILRWEVRPASQLAWTLEERAKLKRADRQGNLFSRPAQRKLRELQKLPIDVYVHYTCRAGQSETVYVHKIVDWEIGALYWNCVRDHGPAWEAPFRQRLASLTDGRELIFMLGTIHRFPDQWLVISLLYPPRQPAPDQLSLFDM